MQRVMNESEGLRQTTSETDISVNSLAFSEESDWSSFDLSSLDLSPLDLFPPRGTSFKNLLECLSPRIVKHEIKPFMSKTIPEATGVENEAVPSTVEDEASQTKAHKETLSADVSSHLKLKPVNTNSADISPRNKRIAIKTTTPKAKKRSKTTGWIRDCVALPESFAQLSL